MNTSRSPIAHGKACHARRRHGARARGAAMIEFLLAMPLLLVILLLLLFFGRGMARMQNTINVAHYELWRQAVPARHVTVADSWSVAPAAHADSDNLAINDTFFRGRAESIDIDARTSFPYEAGYELVAAATGQTADLIDEVHFRRSAPGRAVTAKVTHQESIAVWEQLDPRMRHTQVGFSNPWSYVHGFRVTEDLLNAGEIWRYDSARRSDPHVEAAVRDVFFDELDQHLVNAAPVNGRSNTLASRLRSLYTYRPGYRGPEVSF